MNISIIIYVWKINLLDSCKKDFQKLGPPQKLFFFSTHGVGMYYILKPVHSYVDCATGDIDIFVLE